MKYLVAAVLFVSFPSLAATTVFTSKSQFDSAVGGSTKVLVNDDLWTRDWDGCGCEPYFIPMDLVIGPELAVGSTKVIAQEGRYLTAYYDAYDGPYVANGNSSEVFFQSPNDAWGIDIGAFFLGGDVIVTANGVSRTITIPDHHFSTTFIGFTSDSAISASIKRAPGSTIGEIDFARFYEAGSRVVVPPAGVPEPSIWLMLLIAFGVTGLTMRKKKGPKIGETSRLM